MTENDYNAAWQKLVDAVVGANAADELRAVALASAEAVGRAMAKTYENGRVHALMCARQEFFYELADGIAAAQEASSARAKVEEAERIRRELESS